MKHLLRFSLVLMFTLISSFSLMSNKSFAITSVCSWYSDGTDPWIYASHTYTSVDATFGNAWDVFTVMTSPFYATASNYGPTYPSGGTHGHETIANQYGDTYFHQSELVIGHMTPEGMFTPQLLENCAGTFEFNKPSASVVITPSVVTEGDPVTITWGSNHADSCTFDGAPIATSGMHPFTAALSDSRSYTLECQNQWGIVDAVASLLVNPAPQLICPPVPSEISVFNYPNPGTTSPLPDYGAFNIQVSNNPEYEIKAYCESNTWELKVTKLDVKTVIGANLIDLSPPDMDSSSCSELELMIDSLNYHSSYAADSGRDSVTYPYFMLEAIIKHEEVHFEKFQYYLNQYFLTFLSDIHSISIPLSSADNASDARTLMSTDIADAIASLRDEINESKADANHQPSGLVPWSEFTAASHLATDPVVGTLTDLANDEFSCGI